MRLSRSRSLCAVSIGPFVVCIVICFVCSLNKETPEMIGAIYDEGTVHLKSLLPL